jgi:hypothetical protein
MRCCSALQSLVDDAAALHTHASLMHARARPLLQSSISLHSSSLIDIQCGLEHEFLMHAVVGGLNSYMLILYPRKRVIKWHTNEKERANRRSTSCFFLFPCHCFLLYIPQTAMECSSVPVDACTAVLESAASFSFMTPLTNASTDGHGHESDLDHAMEESLRGMVSSGPLGEIFEIVVLYCTVPRYLGATDDEGLRRDDPRSPCDREKRERGKCRSETSSQYKPMPVSYTAWTSYVQRPIFQRQ